ncbi:hypothetical protein PsYK624_096580 [Phanerochaete sordida]|uniref:Uncharacterized protein n=1 Tax=Phanerochaete sordida TaxID=48140 RepID=A0A9P3GH22_9APHY|nr:hypothetical protein PsYK624_096580 [Phanerochaete sordida]
MPSHEARTRCPRPHCKFPTVGGAGSPAGSIIRLIPSHVYLATICLFILWKKSNPNLGCYALGSLLN